MRGVKSTPKEIIGALWVIACLFWFSSQAPTLFEVDDSSPAKSLSLTLDTEYEGNEPDVSWLAASSATAAGAERKASQGLHRK